MNLPDIDQLGKIIDLCRKKGVQAIEIDNVKITLRADIPQSRYKKKQAEAIDVPEVPTANFTSDDTPIETDSLTEEQLLNWSVMDPVDSTEPPTEKIGQ